MNLNRNIMDFLQVIEKSTTLDSYTLIPMLLREEIKSIKWAPEFKFDADGHLIDIIGKLEIELNDKKKAA